MSEPDRVLRVDSRAGLGAGLLMLLLSPWLAGLYALPLALVVTVALVNFGYGIYSGTLVWRRTWPVWQLYALIVANAAWALICLLIIAHIGAQASVLGILHFLAEAVFVGGLAVVEWRQRHGLIAAARPPATG